MHLMALGSEWFLLQILLLSYLHPKEFLLVGLLRACKKPM